MAKMILKDLFESPINGEWGNELSEGQLGLKVIRTTNFTNIGKLDLTDVVKRDISLKDDSKLLRKGDIIIEKSGGSPSQPVGRVVLFNLEEPFVCNNFTSILRPKRGDNPKFLLYMLLNLYNKRVVLKYQNKTTGLSNLKLNDYLNSTKVIIPDINIQNKIVLVLDIVQSLIDKRKLQINACDELIKSQFAEMFGDLQENSFGWKTYSFNEIFEITSSKRILKSEWRTEGVPFLRVRDMVQLSTTGKLDNEYFVSEEFYSKLSDNDGIPMEGDILVSATSTLGKCYIVKKGECFYFKDADVLRFRTKKDLNGTFFVNLMNTKYIKDQILKTLGITTVSHLTIAAAKKLYLRYPDMDIQNQFATFVHQVEKLKSTLQLSLTELETNFNALMQKAFNGELIE